MTFYAFSAIIRPILFATVHQNNAFAKEFKMRKRLDDMNDDEFMEAVESKIESYGIRHEDDHHAELAAWIAITDIVFERSRYDDDFPETQ